METIKLFAIKIIAFWDWFLQNCNGFGSNLDNEQLLHQLDDQVSKLGPFSWEIGPGVLSSYQLVISPAGNLELLQLTKKIISLAKFIPNWEFHYAKQPKDWEFIFDFEKSDKNQIEIDANKWKYVLIKYDDGMFEIFIQTHDLKGLDDDDKLNIVEILLDGIIGEEKRMLKICGIEVVEEFENQFKGKESQLKDLSSHFSNLIQ